MKEIKYWTDKLKLLPHPEGGYYREEYRSDMILEKSCLPTDFMGQRSVSTAIYYLLTAHDFSAFHRIHSDEIWHFYAGDPLDIYIIHADGSLEVKCLHSISQGAKPMQVVPKACWFAARSTGAYTLSGCTVAPGFDFADFEMATAAELKRQFPQQTEVIERFTRS